MVKIGYYPGDPIPRPPRPSGGKYIPPVYDFEDFDVLMKAMEYDIKGLANLPQDVKESIVADFKRQLQLSVGPTGKDYGTERGLLVGDLEENPGVSVKFDFNPESWAEDPKAQARKTVESWVTGIVSWDDIRNYAERHYFWEPLLRGADTFTPTGEDTPEMLKWADSAAEKIAGSAGGGTTPVHGKAFQLVGLNATNAQMNDNPIYSGYASSFKDFLDKAESAGARNPAYVKQKSSAITGIATEIQNRFGMYDMVPKPDGTYKWVLKDASSLPANLSSDVAEEAAAFVGAQGILFDMNWFSSHPGGLGVKNVIGDLSSMVLEGSDTLRGAVIKRNSSGDLPKIATEFHLSEGEVPSAAQVVLFKLKGLSEYSGNIDSKIAELEKKGYKRAAAALRKDPDVQKFKNYSKQIGEIYDRFKGDPSKLAGKATAAALINELTVLNNGLINGGYFNKGALHSFSETIVNKNVLGGASMLGATGVQGVGMQKVFDHAVQQAQDMGLQSGVRNVQMNLRFARNSFNRNDVKDFTTTIEKDRLTQDLFMTYLKPRIQAFTPAFYASEVLKNNHYFGFYYDPKVVEREMRRSGALSAEILNSSTVEDTRYFEKYTSRHVFTKLMKENIFNVVLDGKKIEVLGGNHLSFIPVLYDDFLNHPEITTLNSVLSSSKKFTGQFSDGGTAFIALLNGDASIFAKLAGDSGLYEFQKDNYPVQLNLLKKWLEKHKDEFGLAFDSHGNLIQSADNAKRLGEIFKQMGERNHLLKISLEKIGYLQQISYVTNRIQKEIYKRFGKYIAPYAKLRNAISAALSQALIQGISAATGGLGELLNFLKPVIQFVVNYILNKIEDLGKAVLKSVFQGPKALADWGNSLEKLFMKSMRYAVYAVLASLIPFFLLFALFTAVMTTISPIDPSRTGGVVNLPVGGIGAGPIPAMTDCTNADDGGIAGLSGGSGIAGSALSLAGPRLIPGFWCYWNHHLDYPQFWNQAAYDANPSPTGAVDGWNLLFWCTYLVIEAYHANGVTSIGYEHINSNTMAERFGYHSSDLTNGETPQSLESNYNPGSLSYISNRGDGVSMYGIMPGDVMFFRTPGRASSRLAHVAVVFSVTADSVETIHANSGLKRWTFTRDLVTGKVQSNQWFEIYGFGRAN